MTKQAHQEIEQLFERLGTAHANKDADRIVDCYEDNAVIFSLAPPLQSVSMSRENTAAWLSTWQGPIKIDAQNVNLVVEGDVAWSSALNRMRGTKKDGEVVDLWFRTTMCLRKVNHEWKILHDHSSVPFYMDGTYRAAVDLTPDTEANGASPVESAASR